MQLSLADLAADNLQLWINWSGMMVDTLLISDHWILREPKPRTDRHPSKLPSAVLSTIFYAIAEPCLTAALLWLSVPPWILVIQSIVPQGLSLMGSAVPLSFAVLPDRQSSTEKTEIDSTESERPSDGSWVQRLSISNISPQGRCYFAPIATSAYANACLLLFSQNAASAFDRSLIAVGFGYYALIAFWTVAVVKTWLIRRTVPLQSSKHMAHFLHQLGLAGLQLAIKMILRMALGLDPLLAFRKVDAVRAEELFGDARYEWIRRHKLKLPWWFPLAASGLSCVLAFAASHYMGRYENEQLDELALKTDSGRPLQG